MCLASGTARNPSRGAEERRAPSFFIYRWSSRRSQSARQNMLAARRSAVVA